MEAHNTAIVATEYLKEESKIRVIYSEEFEHGDPQRIVNLIFDLYHKYGFQFIYLGLMEQIELLLIC